MNRNAAALLAPIAPEAEAVLATLAASGLDERLKLNDLSSATGLPTGHVGRHLRTLERDRMVRYLSGAWLPTPRGIRHATDVAGDLVPIAA
jgi:DNA-binding IclR family transcriptional regulator